MKCSSIDEAFLSLVVGMIWKSLWRLDTEQIGPRSISRSWDKKIPKKSLLAVKQDQKKRFSSAHYAT
jgi:hypothetical protein